MNTAEQIHQGDLQRLKSLRYMDDDFMTVCLADNFEGVELILRIVLGLEDIKIKSVRTQETMKNLQGRSATLDVLAVDSANKEFDVDYSDFRFIPINSFCGQYLKPFKQVYRNKFLIASD